MAGIGVNSDNIFCVFAIFVRRLFSCNRETGVLFLDRMDSRLTPSRGLALRGNDASEKRDSSDTSHDYYGNDVHPANAGSGFMRKHCECCEIKA
ncbi:hypothetical protein [uncultured Nitrosomonas sp.]|uniref:hypothetical protein n=1 Tax=uncultured Nitrosomonas sp. TaxID=156424 RepID=UPI0025FFF8C4|nr:hypothetical protein [uncultured Nitrosomonas sp.]